MFLKVDHYENLNVKYNPFSYLNEQELIVVTEDRINLEEIAEKIKFSKSCLVQFYGKQGRGKSTHLQALHELYFSNSDFYKLQKKQRTNIKFTDQLMFVDSFQLLSLKNRLQLLNKQQKLVIGVHNSQNKLRWLKREYNYQINFNNLKVDINLLEKIVTARLELARLDMKKPLPKIRISFLNLLLKKHDTNLRAIQTALYDLFLDPKREYYEL